MYPTTAAGMNASIGQISDRNFDRAEKIVSAEREVPEKLQGLFSQIETLTETAHVLISRLSPVLGPDDEKVAAVGPGSRPDATPLGSQISEARSRLQIVTTELSIALRRLEL